jgi:hypothetical protein
MRVSVDQDPSIPVSAVGFHNQGIRPGSGLVAPPALEDER